MKNGFYFNTEAIPAEYFLLKKINLIENHDKPLDFNDQEPFLFINELSYKFCSAFEYHHQSDFVVVFNSMSTQQMSELKEKLRQNPNQKILFVAHILFDYQSVLRDLLDLVGAERILILVDNLKHPYIVSENEILTTGIQGLNSNHFLVYTKKSAVAKAKVTPHFFTFLKYSIYYFFKMILKPKQFIQDFIATYNMRFFYGKIKGFFVQMRVFFIKVFFSVRHFSVMSAIRFIYGLKVFFIRFFYWLVEKVKMSFLRFFYGIRHLTVMSAIRFIYGLKVFFIRFFYWSVGAIKIASIKIFYGTRHFFAMLPVYLRRLFYLFIEYIKLPVVRFFYWYVGAIKMTSIKIFYGARHFFTMFPVYFMRFCFWTLEKFKMTSLKIFYSFRHLTVMSMIRFVYGSKVFFIRFFYWSLERLNRLGVWLYFGFRHVLVMSFVHVYYGIKVFVIRAFYWISGITKLVFIRSYFLLRHTLVMFFVWCNVVVKVTLIFVYYKILAIVNYTRGALIWFYYFNKKYTLYPFRKMYWFISFQLNKRVWKRNL